MTRAIRAFFGSLTAFMTRKARELEGHAKSCDEQQYWRGYEQGVYDAEHFCIQHHQVRKYD